MAQTNGRVKRFSWWRLLWKIISVTVRAIIGFSILGIAAGLMIIFTSRGTSLAWSLAADKVEGLSGEMVSGHLGRGFHIRNFSLDIPDVISVSARDFEIQYNLAGLLLGHFTVDDLVAQDVLLVIGNRPLEMPLIGDFLAARLRETASWVRDYETGRMIRVNPEVPDPTAAIAPAPALNPETPPEDTEEEAASEESFISIPLDVHVDAVRVKNFLMLSDAVDVAVSDLYLRAGLKDDTVTVHTADASYIDVQLHDERMPDSPPSPPVPLMKEPFSRTEIADAVSKLPTVFLPIKIRVDALTLDFVRYHQTVYDTGVMRGFLKGSYIGADISVSEFRVDHHLGHAMLTDSTMTLRDYYPMDVNLSAWSENDEWFDFLDHHRLAATGKGDLVDLNVHAVISGKADLTADARLNTLGPSLPFEARVSGRNLGWPILNPEYSAGTLETSARGTLDGITAEIAAGGIRALNYPELNLKLAAFTDMVSADIKSLSVVSTDKKHEVKLNGHADFDKIYGFKGEVKARTDDLARFVPDFPAALELSLRPEFAMKAADSSWKTEVKDLDLQGVLKGYPLSLSGRLIRANSSLDAEIRGLSLINGGKNYLTAEGVLGQKSDLAADIDLKDLSLLYPDLKGGISGKVSMTGSLTAPNAVVNLKSQELEFGDLKLRKLDLGLDAASRNEHLTKADLALKLGELFSGGSKFVDTLHLSLKGGEESHDLSLKARTVAGHLDLALHGGLDARRTRYLADVSRLSLVTRELTTALKDHLAVETRLSPDLQVRAREHSWLVNGNQLTFQNLEWNPAQARVKLTAPEIKLNSFRAFIPEIISLPFSAALNADLTLVRNRPQGSVSLEIPGGSLVYDRREMTFDRVSLNAAIRPDRLNTVFLADLGTNGSLNAELAVTDPAGQKQSLSGTYRINSINLGLLSKMLGEVAASSGYLEGNGTFAGSLTSPGLNGQIRIRDMNVTPAMDLGTISDINTTLSFNGHSADMHGGFVILEKNGRFNGKLTWDPELDATISLDTDDLLLDLFGYGQGIVKVNIAGHFSDKVNELSGKIAMPYARIKVRSLPPSSQALSKDVHEMVRTEDGGYSFQRGGTLPMGLDLDISIGNDVKLTAMGLKSDIRGKLQIKQPPRRQMSLTGEIRAENGTIHKFGQDLIIKRGRISFVGDPSEPNLDIRAIRNPRSMDNDNITVGIAVTGTASRPHIKLFSKPQLSQSETLSYLLRGKGMDASSANTNDMSTQLLLGAGLMQAEGVLSDVGEKLGLQDMALDSRGDGDETSVELSAYIMPKLQVAYGYGIYNAISEFRIRYEMFPRFYIEGVSSLEQAVDALYKFEFNMGSDDSDGEKEKSAAAAPESGTEKK